MTQIPAEVVDDLVKEGNCILFPIGLIGIFPMLQLGCTQFGKEIYLLMLGFLEQVSNPNESY